ncbi:oxidoreductase [Rugosimonospora africana]|uniref:Oxidoreductase n=1 Tax=Rugosimonospora africana TaxID=556532 RepID=A0A8J3VUQ0_9ACTN|nr:oxidoreductase [Rugosimonospora africana]
MRPRGPRLPTLGLGTAPLGFLYEPVDDEQAAATIARALEGGVSYLDTAPGYGLGVAEARVGRALRSADPGVIVSTKVGRVLTEPAGPFTPPFPGAPRLRARFDFSRDGILRSLEDSLRRLGTDRVDVVYLHDPDDHEDEVYRSAYPTLARLREEKVVGAIGVGMNQSAMPARFVSRLDLDLVLLAGRYSLLDHSAITDLLPACARRGVGVVVGGVFNSGILVDPGPHARYAYSPASDDELARALRVREVCRRHGVPMSTAAMRFPLGDPAVVSVLVGMRSPAEVAANLAAFGHPVPDDLWSELRAEGLLAPDTPTPTTGAPPGLTPVGQSPHEGASDRASDAASDKENVA